ncbi:MAG: PKD domain-containing protein [Planctomycetes bacterium]|nr:PKD domain-containing protein [Planctomycetota bacterium]
MPVELRPCSDRGSPALLPFRSWGVCWLLFGMSAIGRGSVCAEPWWDQAWSHRLAVEVSAETLPNLDRTAAHARIPTSGRCRPDGADLRVIAPSGKPAAYHRIDTHPETETELIFSVSEGPGVYWIYFGNAGAEPRSETFAPRCGLTLAFHELGRFPSDQPVLQQTWERDGMIMEYKDFVSYVESKGRLIEAQTWPRLELDHGPRGPVKESLLVFHGWLRVAAAGEYVFTIASDDPAAILLRGVELAAPGPKSSKSEGVTNLHLEVGEDDIETAMTVEESRARPEGVQKTVLYFPGGRKEFHRRTHGRATFTGKVALKEGIKELSYYQTIWKDLQFASLAWMRPGQPSWQVLQAKDFVQPVEARAARLEVRDDPAASAFELRELNTYWIDQHRYIEVEAEVIGPRADLSYAWNFGDGVDNVTGPKVTHVYLSTGPFKVTLTSSRGDSARSEFSLTAYVTGAYHRESDFDRTIARYASILEKYPFHQLPTPYFQACMTLFEKVYPQPAALVKVLAAYVDTHTPRKEAGAHEGEFLYYAMPEHKRITPGSYQNLRDTLSGFYMHLASWQRHPAVEDPDGAIRTYRRLLEFFPDHYPASIFDKRGAAFLQIGRTCLEQKRLEQAGRLFEEMEEDARDGFREWQYHGGSGLEADRYRHWIRFAMVGQADVAVRRGDLDLLKTVCERADKEQRKPLKPAVASSRRSTHQTTVEDFIRRAWTDDALGSIDEWEIEFPKDKLKGMTEFLRCKVYLQKRQYARALESLHLARSLMESADDTLAEVRFLEAEIRFWSGERQEAARLYGKFLEEFHQDAAAEVARRRLSTLDVIRLDLGDEPEPYLVEHQAFRIHDDVYPLVDAVPGWGGHYRMVARHCPLTYEFPIPAGTPRILLRLRKKGIMLLEINGKPFWQEPHDRKDEDVVDLDLLLTDASQWSGGKIRLTFRDGLNYWPYWDPVSLFIDWLELHLLRVE